MIDYVIVVTVSLLIVWLARRQWLLGRQVDKMQSAIEQIQTASAMTIEESVAQMVEELKSIAATACDQVTQAVAMLRTVQSELENRAPEAACDPPGREALPVALIARLADEGVSAVEIAKQTGAGLAEVELALRVRRGKMRQCQVLDNWSKNMHEHDQKGAVA